MSDQRTQEEEAVKQATNAMHRGFITQLQHGGKARIERVKQAGEGGAEEEVAVIKRSDFDRDDVKGIFSKYAGVWLPHRQEVTQGYYNRIVGAPEGATA